MRSTRVLRAGVVIGLLSGVAWAAVPPPAHAVWVSVDPVTGKATQFKVGGQVGAAITPTPTTFPDTTFIDPTCGTQGGTSMAIAQGSKLAAEHGVDPITNPIVLVVSCLDNSNAAKRAQLYFLNPADGKVVKSIQTRTTISGVLVNPFAPSNGWAHLVLRPDKGDLLGCGNDGTIYRIEFSQFSASIPGTATSVARPSGLPSNCASLSWDPDADMIYQGVSGGNNVVGVHRFQEAAAPTDLGFFNLPGCTPSGVAITGGVVVVACKTASTILRLDKTAGTILGVNGTLGVLGLAAGTNLSPGLGDLACDPVTFQRDSSGKDQFTDALWSRRGTNGNGVVALEFPAFTCGLPSNANVLAAGLSAPALGQPGAVPLAACFDASGKVKDSDGDGLPDCWETSGIDFDGDGGTADLTLCVQVDTNGDGIPDATECAGPNHKDLFVEIDYMKDHKPDPLALSQTQSVASVGVKSVREAFAAAPVSNPDNTTGIRIHFLVDEQVTFTTLAGGSASHVTQLAFTPCTGPGSFAVSQSNAADFDVIKKASFGTAAERANANSVKILNAKRLAFHYMLFAHNQVGASAGAGSSSSGCSEVGGDDVAITLGTFATTLVGGILHARGTTDQQAGTLMHELGHNLGLRHGGGDNHNCKPNYLSVMSYTRQIAGSPIPNRRLDYSRADLPDVNKASLDEILGLGADPSLSPVPGFPLPDSTAFGPTAWTVVAANAPPINWNKSSPDPSPESGNINQGPGGCDGSGTVMQGHDDWKDLLYRASAALDFAGGIHTATPSEHTSITTEQEEALFLAADLDGNGVADAQDCGTFLCRHRIDIKPSSTFPKFINLGTEANLSIAIFSEVSGPQVWDAVGQVNTFTLTLSVESTVIPVKLNTNGQGTCSARDVADPDTGLKDGVKDFLCQFPTSALPLGTHQGVVFGFFTFTDVLGQPQVAAFRARQEFTVVQ